MLSCNAKSVKWAINPIKTAGCVIKESCNALCADLTVSSIFTGGWQIKRSCNAFLVFFQYPGLSFLHCWTRTTLSGPRKCSRFSGLLSQRCWLSFLLALRQSGLEQYFWRLALRGSGGNNSLQCLHFFFFMNPMAIVPPRGYNKKKSRIF